MRKGSKYFFTALRYDLTMYTIECWTLLTSHSECNWFFVVFCQEYQVLCLSASYSAISAIIHIGISAHNFQASLKDCYEDYLFKYRKGCCELSRILFFLSNARIQGASWRSSLTDKDTPACVQSAFGHVCSDTINLCCFWRLPPTWHLCRLKGGLNVSLNKLDTA